MARTCGNGALRSLKIELDGSPVLLTSLRPYIYTGGIDHFLWFPTPGVQTLNLLPQKIDVSFLAGLLNSKGGIHNISIQVYPKYNHFWNLNANLFVFLDDNVQGGGILVNTLPTVISTKANGTVSDSLNFTNNNQNYEGKVETLQDLKYNVSGLLIFSDGRKVTYSSEFSIYFHNIHFLNSSGSDYCYNVVNQSSSFTQNTTSTTVFPNGSNEKIQSVLYWDFFLSSNTTTLTVANAEDTYNKFADVLQIYRTNFTFFPVDYELNYFSDISNLIHSKDVLQYILKNDSFTPIKNFDTHSIQNYSFIDNTENCYFGEVTSINNALNNTVYGSNCPGNSNSLDWWVDPYYGFPPLEIFYPPQKRNPPTKKTGSNDSPLKTVYHSSEKNVDGQRRWKRLYQLKKIKK